MTHSYDTVSVWFSNSPINWPVLAQQIRDPKVLDQMQNAFNYFIKSGQVWALLIGLFFGYLIRGITA
ncbi:hypothetical protein H6G60_09555 [Coleofasciculus sp. FACHB-SPT36]|nr:hypothetical protein [Coleofasciculus sp. FACHB-SPT36]